jgi:vitamin B12 transporter
MLTIVRRAAAQMFLSAGHFPAQSSKRFRSAILAVMVLFALLPLANAVVIRGTVTDPLGAVVVGARVQLIQGQSNAAVGVTGDDGTYEIRSTAAGRFVLLTSAATFTVGVSDDFYGGRTDIVTRNIVLSPDTVKTDVSVTATGIPTPIQQVSSAVTLVPQANLLTQLGLVNELRQSPGVDVVQTGQTGGVTSLFVRGGNSTANQVTLDGITMNDVGGYFDFGTVSSTGVGGVELYRGSNSALYGTDAGASVVNLETPRGTTLKPVLNYSGDAGNFHEYRNEGVLSGTWSRLDYLLGFSRLDASNALQRNRYHSATSVANVGMSLMANTQARFTLRNAVSATGLPQAHDFYGISADAKQGDQDIYSGLTLENRYHGNWHNLARYDITRKHEQEQAFTNVGTPISYDFNGGPCTPQSQGCFTEYFGNLVTIRGANGYSATGRASFFVPNEKSVSNRDELYYQSDYSFGNHLMALFGFRYENERGSFVTDFENETIQRTNYQYTMQFQGDWKNRFFYSLGGGVEKNHLYGITGTPRIGLAFVPVRTGNGFFQGTKIRANVATGVQEPSLALEFASFYNQLLQAGQTAAIAKYNVMPAGPQRSRTYDIGIDQNIMGQKLVVKLGYFHNTFDHQMEGVDSGAMEQIFGYPPSVINTVFTHYLNSLAFRAQGIEAEAEYQAPHHFFLRGGYTYLDAVVLQSFSSDAYNNGVFGENPNIPGVPIGAEGPLVGQRPFRRPPHTGFFAVQYESKKFTAAFKGALASRSDDSTFLDGFDVNFGNTLVLPNRNLDYGYAKLDLGGIYAATHRVGIFAQLDNLLSQQHIGPIGYPSLPFTFRVGIKFRLGGD